MDADLQEVQRKGAGEDGAVKSFPDDAMKSSVAVRKVSELRNNNSTSVTAKLQGLLEKINASAVQQPKTKDKDNSNGMQNEDNTEFGDGSQFHSKESSKSKTQNTCDDENSESDDDTKVLYRSEMLKQAMSDFYKGQSTVSFLRRFIYTNGKNSVSYTAPFSHQKHGGRMV